MGSVSASSMRAVFADLKERKTVRWNVKLGRSSRRGYEPLSQTPLKPSQLLAFREIEPLGEKHAKLIQASKGPASLRDEASPTTRDSY